MKKAFRLASLSLFAAATALLIAPSMGLTEDAAKATPESVYHTYHKAMLNAKTYKDVQPFLVAKAVKEMNDTPAEERTMMFGMLKELCPKDVRVISSTVEGDKASLKLVVGDGKPVVVDRPIVGKTKEETSGVCTMVIENGEWKVDKESWKTKSYSADSAPPKDAETPVGSEPPVKQR